MRKLFSAPRRCPIPLRASPLCKPLSIPRKPSRRRLAIFNKFSRTQNSPSLLAQNKNLHILIKPQKLSCLYIELVGVPKFDSPLEIDFLLFIAPSIHVWRLARAKKALFRKTENATTSILPLGLQTKLKFERFD